MNTHFDYKIDKLISLSGLPLEDIAGITGYSTRTVYRWKNRLQEPKKAVYQQLLDLVNRKKQSNDNSAFSFIDLFAGIGGMRFGFEEIGGKCVYTSEWNKYSVQTYMANFPCTEHPVEGDITKVEAKDIPKHDVLLAGFPCQPFSIAGVSKKISLGRAHGFLCETQGTLFFDVARIIAYHRPAAFLLENVKNLASHDKGRTFAVIKKTLEQELGYKISYRIIDAKGFVPQHRERIFIAGFRENVNFDLLKLEIPAPENGPKLKTILHQVNNRDAADLPYTNVKGAVNERYTLSEKLWDYLQNYARKHKEKGNGFGFGLFGPDDTARTLSARYYKDGSEILIKQGNKNPRRLTPRECARLMGFEKPNESRFKIPVSDTQAYKQFGNAVVVPVVKAVAKHMLPAILSLKTREQKAIPKYKNSVKELAFVA